MVSQVRAADAISEKLPTVELLVTEVTGRHLEVIVLTYFILNLSTKGKPVITKMDKFKKNVDWPLTPPAPFSEDKLQFFRKFAVQFFRSDLIPPYSNASILVNTGFPKSRMTEMIQSLQ